MQNTEIRVKSHIDPTWSEWLDGLTITHTTQTQTLLNGCLADQSALFSVLAKIRDMGLEVISVNVSESPDIEEPTPRSYEISGSSS